MQLQLPIFLAETTLASNCVGVYERNGLVQYIVNGMPVYSHSKEDFQAFRFIFAILLVRICAGRQRFGSHFM
jgi:hypothetical protein